MGARTTGWESPLSALAEHGKRIAQLEAELGTHGAMRVLNEYIARVVVSDEVWAAFRILYHCAEAALDAAKDKEATP